MKQRYISSTPGNRHLLLIFSGWAHDDAVFRQLSYPGCDIMLVWDYRDLRFDSSALGGYDTVYLFAWSFGVYAASRVLPALDRRNIAFTIAVNGSLCPVDDERGIPKGVFDGTRDFLDDRNLTKFYRRIIGDRNKFAELSPLMSPKDIFSLKEELTVIYNDYKEGGDVYTAWDRVILSDSDKIFPLDNMKRCWESHPRLKILAGEHLPDWKALIDSEIIDSRLVSRNFSKSAATYEANALVQQHMAQRLWALWQEAAGNDLPESICEIGYGTGLLTRLYTSRFSAAILTLIDTVPFKADVAQACNIITGDAEKCMPRFPAQSFDAVVSGATVQWFNSLRMFISHSLKSLKPGGLLVFSTFGKDNLKELSDITGQSLRYYSAQEICGMVNPDEGTVVVAEEERQMMEFPSAKEVVEHLHRTGVNGVRGNTVGLSRIYKDYPVDENGRATLTYHPIYIIIQKRS